MAKISRNTFIKWGLVLAGGVVAGKVWLQKKMISIQMENSNAKIGHLLRDQSYKQTKHAISSKTHIDVCIIGGGISGLSTARMLNKNKVPFLLLELNEELGGNAIGGKNEVSEYPWGAHYLPIANLNQAELISFLKEMNIITGMATNGKPIYNEFFLCSEPEERLYIHHYWQEGLVPALGMKEQDSEEMRRFFKMIHTYKNAVGSDRKEAFCIPIANSSRDKEFLDLDKLTFKDFLHQQNFTSEYLLWYLNYCCKDDFGTQLADTSAWAGIHYFAARKGIADNTKDDDVVTWPEGNNFLVKGLSEPIKGSVQKGAFVISVEEVGNVGVLVTYLNTKNQTYHQVECKNVVMATPQYINKKIVKAYPLPQLKNEYYPLLVANIITKPLAQNKGTEMSWDNVIFRSESLGYVNACHQKLDSHVPLYVLTYYLPLCNLTAKEEREKAFQKTNEEWAEVVLKDLEKAHKDIRQQVEKIDLKIWGHAMISPKPNTIWNEEKSTLAQKDSLIMYAHSDLSGISIFEEAFYQGTKVGEHLSKIHGA